MVLAATGRGCGFELREAFKAVRKVLEAAGMQLNKSKCRRADSSLEPYGSSGRIQNPRPRMLNLPLQFKMGMIRALYPLVLYGSEVSGLAQTSLNKVRISARRALGRGAQLRRAAELELALKGGIKADPQVTLDLYTVRAWQRALLSGQSWPPTEAQWADATKGRRGRGPIRHLRALCDRLGWE
eukprot:4364322-Amphidinium_carterae.1